MTTTPQFDADSSEPAVPETEQQAEVETLKAELEQLRAQSLSERADLENQRKRLDRDVRNAVRFANKQLLGDLLPVLDSLESALANAADADPLRDGVVLTLRELTRVAESNGLVEVAPGVGDAFNPDRHQAMSVLESADVAPGAVAQLFQKGYVLHEQLVRPALVAVSAHD